MVNERIGTYQCWVSVWSIWYLLSQTKRSFPSVWWFYKGPSLNDQTIEQSPEQSGTFPISPSNAQCTFPPNNERACIVFFSNVLHTSYRLLCGGELWTPEVADNTGGLQRPDSSNHLPSCSLWSQQATALFWLGFSAAAGYVQALLLYSGKSFRLPCRKQQLKNPYNSSFPNHVREWKNKFFFVIEDSNYFASFDAFCVETNIVSCYKNTLKNCLTFPFDSKNSFSYSPIFKAGLYWENDESQG